MKGPHCPPCDLFQKGAGFVHPEGSPTSPMLLVGEAAGKVESKRGLPFQGEAGGMLSRVLRLAGLPREALRIANTINCEPPNDWFDERAPWYRSALSCCAPYLDATLAEGHKVVVPMGGTALKRVLGLTGKKGIRVQDWHGTVSRDPTDRYWVVPSYHPSHLQRGATNLIGTVVHDLKLAWQIGQTGFTRGPASIVCDPPVEWFARWVDDYLLALAQDPENIWLSVDVETPDKRGGKDEGEISSEDQSLIILRVNFACHPDEGITVPYHGAYLEHIHRAIRSGGIQLLWNGEYDLLRLLHNGIITEMGLQAYLARFYDLMWAWHYLQSDLPRGLGFVAPLYSQHGAWKHLAESDPVTYAAIDALQTHRCGFGIVEDLVKTGLWAGYTRHVHDLYRYALRPAHVVGVQVSRPKLEAFRQDLVEKAGSLLNQLQEVYPQELRPLTPKAGYKKKPLVDAVHSKGTLLTKQGEVKKGKHDDTKVALYAAHSHILERLSLQEVLCCATCGAQDVQRRHRCGGGAVQGGPPDVSVQTITVTRYFWQEPFNPDSWPQVLAYIKFRKHAPGKAKKTHKDSTDRETLERLEKTGDPFYRLQLDYRAVKKVEGTYATGTLRRLDKNDRIHPVPTFKPSTMRLSYTDPNITNVVHGEEGSLAAGFRKCIVASPGCRLVEFDFSAIESVQTGWFDQDPDYIRLAKLGVHAALASHILKRPYDPAWSDADLALYFKEIKKKEPKVYGVAKRCTHASSYGMTPFGMQRNYPLLFPTIKDAQRTQSIYFAMAPKLPTWQMAMRLYADKQKYLGGPAQPHGRMSLGPSDHPSSYRHHFYAVSRYKKLSYAQYLRLKAQCQRENRPLPALEIDGSYFRMEWGHDANRAVSFFPQSGAAGVLKEVMLALFAPDSPSYIGDTYYGQTPLRAPVHDSLLLELPDRVFDRVVEIVLCEMLRPIEEQPIPKEWGMGDYLSIGVAAKVGQSWGEGEMEDLPVPSAQELGVAGDLQALSDEVEDEEELNALGRVVA